MPAHVAIHPFIREPLQCGVPLFTFLLTTAAAAVKYLANKSLINCLSAGKRLRVKDCVCVWRGGSEEMALTIAGERAEITGPTQAPTS